MIGGDSDWSSELANHLQSPHFIHNVWPRIVEETAPERMVDTKELLELRIRQLALNWLFQNQFIPAVIENLADEICSISNPLQKSKKCRTTLVEVSLPSLEPCSFTQIERYQEDCRKNDIEEMNLKCRLSTCKFSIVMQLVEQLTIIVDIVKIIIDESFDELCTISDYYRLIVENLYLKLSLIKSDLLIAVFDNNIYQTIESFVRLLSQNVSDIKTEVRKLQRSQEAFRNLGANGLNLATRYQRINDQIDLVTDDLNRLRTHQFI